MTHQHGMKAEAERLISIGSGLRTRKNFKDAIPYYERSLRLIRFYKLGCAAELNCSNGLMSSLRQTGPPGCAEAETLIARALDLVSLLGGREVKLCLRAYLNVAQVQILKYDFQAALPFLQSGEELYEKTYSSDAAPDRDLEKIMIIFKYTGVQARQGLLLSEGSEKKDELRVGILTRLLSIVDVKDPSFDKDKAMAHQALGNFYEIEAAEPDANTAAHHRRLALELCGVELESPCPICMDPISVDGTEAIILICCHVYHRSLTALAHICS
jgi:hypothetical protein